MKGIEQYFQKVQTLIRSISDVEMERYEEQILSKDRGNLRIRLRFLDNSLLEISEAVHIVEKEFVWLSYRYHYQKMDGNVIFRYDNAPHHPEISTFPEHKHIGDEVINFSHPSIEKVLSEVKKHIDRSKL